MFYLFTNKVKEFPKEYFYRITREKELGRGFVNGYVFLYKIEYFKNDSLKTVAYLAGKQISNPDFYNEERKYVLLKKLRIVKFTVRKFSTFNNVECTNFDSSSLKKMIFLSDLTLKGYNVEPINIRDKLNLKIISKLSRQQKLYLFNKILLDLVLLLENNFFIRQFDLWFLIYNDKEIYLEIVDLDFLIQIGSNQDEFITKKALKTMFLQMINTNKEIEEIIREILSANGRFKKIIEFYGLENDF